MIEPREGEFDFSNVDQVIFDARHHGLNLVLLWFGTYKNGTSCYVQGWVNMDPARFPQVQIYKDCKDDGDNRQLKCVDVINPFSQAACGADARAFSALMKHIKQIDAAHSTVLMAQIENE
jgi:beta-galactosidase GanA